MELRFYIDPGTGEPHIHEHGVDEAEVEDVLSRPQEDRPGKEGSRVAIGQNSSRARPPRDLRATSHSW